MKKVAIILAVVLAGFFVFRACGTSPEEASEGIVKEFISAIKDGDGKEAVKLLYPPFRDALVQDVKLPLQLTEMKPSEMLACVLSSMGENVKKVKVLDVKAIDDKHGEVIVKVIDKNGTEKILAFITIKDEKRWKIASKGSLRSIKTFSWALFMVLLHAIFLVLQPDKGGALFILLLSFSLMYVGGIPYKLYIPAITLVGFFSFFLLRESYVYERLSAWIDPFADAEDTGYQIIQSLYALAKGGPFGMGIGKGIQKMGALPEADTDYVISIIGEEMGFLGVMMVVLLYALLVGRLFYYSVKVDEPFGKLLLFGVAVNFSLAFLWNLAMASNLLPPKGIALPFVSYGTSNLLASLIMIGLAQSVIRVWQR